MYEPNLSSLLTAFNESEPVLYNSAWIAHIPFAFWLTNLLMPKIVVELGVHLGNSYFAFCQAIKENQLSSRAFAIDTWTGDCHSGKYGEEVYLGVNDYNSQHYSSFSTLLRMSFDQAVENFSNNTIDLLHIDGLHTYEAVKHDFETWLPKLSDQGVVLFHDTNVYEKDFGVYRLWEELLTQYPGFNFHHSFGLGVLLVGKKRNESLLKLSEEIHFSKTTFSTFFEKIGGAYNLKVSLLEKQKNLTSLLHEKELELREKENELFRLKEKIKPLLQLQQTIKTVKSFIIK